MTDKTRGHFFALPASIMKVIRPRSIPRQCTLSAFGDSVLGSIARTLMWLSMSMLLPLLRLWLWLLLLMLLVRRSRLRITNAVPIGIDHRRERT